MNNKNSAFIFKYIPYYRKGVFSELIKSDIEFNMTFYTGVKEQESIRLIDLNKYNDSKIIRTNTYFYKPSLLLWQSGIIKNILLSKHKVFIFDGAISHLPVWIFLILCKITGKKSLLWSHGFKGIDKGLKLRLRLLFFKTLASGNIIYGNHEKKIMIQLGFNPKNITVIYNSLESQLQREILTNLNTNEIYLLKKKYFINPNLFTILFIGRLIKKKNVLQVAKLCNDLHKEGNPINCIFIGKGEEEDTLCKFIDKNSLNDYTYFTGELYDEKEIAKYFSMTNLMVSPGNVGLNCIHSLGYGVPVLTHNNFAYQNPEVEAIENGKTGILYEYNDYNDMLLKLKHFINSDYNKNITKSLCFEKIDNKYNPENQCRLIKTAVKNILSNDE